VKMLGLIGKKIGMTQVPHEGGTVPCTVIEAGPCWVIQRKIKEKDGYEAIKLGFGNVKKEKLTKPELFELKKVFGEKEVYPAFKKKEFRVPDSSLYPEGTKIGVEIFKEGDRVDVTGISKGKGFQGVIKRWGFSGGPKSHGSKSHRRPGSIGQHTDPGRIWKGKKMAGHMGMKKTTVVGLKVIKLNPEKNLILLKGAVPGPKGSFVLIRKSKRYREK